MGGWYKLGSYDAHQLANVIGQVTSDRNRVARADMALFLFSQINGKAEPCPCFTTGIRTLAKECRVTPRVAQRFMERMEADGHIVCLGESKTKGGRYQRRTFAWMAEEAAEDAGMPLGEWLRMVGGVTDGVTESGYTPPNISQQEWLHGCNQTPPTLVTHQSAEHSEDGALRLSANAEAQAPIIDQSTDTTIDALGNVAPSPARR